MIETLLMLSTAHLCQETCNDWLRQAPFAVFGKGDYGWFVYVPDDEPEDLPADLRDCFTLARSCNCDWVMFDCDADTVSALPIYAW